MGQVFIGWFTAGAQTRASISLTTVFNPEGDWGNAYQLAHPGSAVNGFPYPTELICDFHAKRLRRLPSGDFLYDYRVTITVNASSGTTSVFVDW
jgi:hypothetical protein